MLPLPQLKMWRGYFKRNFKNNRRKIGWRVNIRRLAVAFSSLRGTICAPPAPPVDGTRGVEFNWKFFNLNGPIVFDQG